MKAVPSHGLSRGPSLAYVAHARDLNLEQPTHALYRTLVGVVRGTCSRPRPWTCRRTERHVESEPRQVLSKGFPSGRLLTSLLLLFIFSITILIVVVVNIIGLFILMIMIIISVIIVIRIGFMVTIIFTSTSTVTAVTLIIIVVVTNIITIFPLTVTVISSLISIIRIVIISITSTIGTTTFRIFSIIIIIIITIPATENTHQSTLTEPWTRWRPGRRSASKLVWDP